MKIKLSGQLPFFLAVVVNLEKVAKDIPVPERGVDEAEQGMELLMAGNDGEAFSLVATFGEFHHPIRQAVLEVSPYEDGERECAFWLRFVNYEEVEVFSKGFTFSLDEGVAAGAGGVIAGFIHRYLFENVIPAFDAGVPEQISLL